MGIKVVKALQEQVNEKQYYQVWFDRRHHRGGHSLYLFVLDDP
jgi:hypothetical protein